MSEYSVFGAFLLNRKLIVRVSDIEYNHVKAMAKHLKTSDADIVRQYIEQNMNPTAILLPLAEGEKNFLEGVAEDLGVTLDQAIRLIIYTHKTLMQAPLGKVVKPMKQILEESAKHGENTEYFEGGK